MTKAVAAGDVRRARRLAAGGAVALLALVACTQRPTTSPQPGERTLAAIAPEAKADPLRAAAYDLIRSPERPQESLLWLRALAVSSVQAPSDSKLNQVLDCRQTGSGDCVFRLTQNSAEAVIVSRDELQKLRAVRGPLDVERLERYITWAARPESLTVRRPQPGHLEIHANLGPRSAILLRHDYDGPWRVEPPSVALREDPIGYLVLDPGELHGPLDIVLEAESAVWPFGGSSPADKEPPDTGKFPLISPEGVVDGSTFAGPPFPPGAVLSIFGKRFGETGNQLQIGGTQPEPLYESATQINFRLPQTLKPGSHELTVTTRGRAAEPYPIEVQP